MNIIFYSLKVTYPFLIVILMTIMILGIVGMSIFGGRIHSGTRELFLQYAGYELHENYELLNWNDLFNSFSFMYCLIITYSFPELLAMTLVEARDATDFRWIYFVFFEFLINMSIMNIFIGMVIGIGLENFKKEMIKEEDEYEELDS
jgi:Ion transport protein